MAKNRTKSRHNVVDEWNLLDNGSRYVSMSRGSLGDVS